MSNGNDKQNNGNGSGNTRDNEPVPLNRQDYGDLNKSLGEQPEVRNSMPPPPNPNRGGGQKDD